MEREYEIEMRETLSRVQRIKAESMEEAIDKVRKSYDRQEIVLDSSDYQGVNYIPLSGENPDECIE